MAPVRLPGIDILDQGHLFQDVPLPIPFVGTAVDDGQGQLGADLEEHQYRHAKWAVDLPGDGRKLGASGVIGF